MATPESALFSMTVHNDAGVPVSLSQFRGQALLIVNVASRCAFTPQYKGLEALFEKYEARGFSVLAFPCNQFGSQETGSAQEIRNFCEVNFAIKFPIMAKVDVNGAQAHPLFVYLKNMAPGLFGTKVIKWNFTKFLLNQEGQVVKRFGPRVTPEKIDQEVANLLN